MKQRDDYEFKVMLSEISIVQQGSTLTELVRRKARVVTQSAAQSAERNFIEALSNVMIIIGGLADPVINLTRGLTIWSVLVLGAGGPAWC